MAAALPTVALIGSCVSRDLFNDKLNPGWRTRFALGPTHFQSSILSIFGSEVPLSPGALGDVDAHTRECVTSELSRQFARGLHGPAPDLVLVDFFSDTAFNSIVVGDGFITDNRWKIATSAEYRRFDGLQRIGVDHDVEAFGIALMRAFMNLRAALDHYWPQAKVVVNRARGASEYTDAQGVRQAFERARVMEFNARWDWIEHNFLRCFPDAVVIDPMENGVVADAEHPWGKYWVHYESRYYQRADSLLCAVAGVEPPVEAVETPARGSQAVPADDGPVSSLTRGAAEDAGPVHGQFRFEDVSLTWRAVDGAADRRHLLVVLSGFRPPNAPYDLAVETARRIGCDVLWVRDDVDGECTYYLRRGGSDVVARAVQDLIRTAARERGLEMSDVSLAGFSKGASAAIVHGAALQVGTVLASVPQSRIGSYAEENWPAVHAHMGSSTAELDALVPAALHGLRHAPSVPHVFVLTSSKDPQYEAEVAPIVPLVRALPTGQMLISESARVDSHQAVSRESRDLVVSLLSLAAQGLVPRFSSETFGDLGSRAAVLDAQWDRREHVATVRSLSFDGNGRLHVSGDAFLRGRPLEGYGVVRRRLVLRSETGSAAFDLGTVLDEGASVRHHRAAWCDYKAGAFSTVGRAGIDIADVAPGRYSLHVSLAEHDRRAEVPLAAQGVRGTFGSVGAKAFDVQINPSTDALTLTVADFTTVNPDNDRYFALDELRFDDGRLFVSGRYACRGIPVREWGQARYFLLLHGTQGWYSRALGIVDRPDPQLPFEDPESYRKSAFTSIGGEGVDLGTIPDGTYAVGFGVFGSGRADSVDSGRSLTLVDGVAVSLGEPVAARAG